MKVLKCKINKIEREKPTSYKKRKFHLNIFPGEHDADVTAENFFVEEEGDEVSLLKLQLGGMDENLQMIGRKVLIFQKKTLGNKKA